ncbi:ABC transporter ATP-binding protein [Actinocrispum wychmicini]|uniref:Putative ABC transport system ATP-binding protein n=1 Tax=Actinocrispum wychmicini TaxID=1213861 RepID=A0A4R2JFE2_9PSEU|nr:ABC transporter ATP-binding protein [Actinocrispum wychmicini]TCO57307.1 putative ABC transport system ATP-binding protein [Actinocrispum wychmicini]
MSTQTFAPVVTPALRLAGVSKVYGSGDGQVHALRNVSIELRRGTFTAVMGPSGSGKSTFLHCAAGLDQPTSGQVWLGDAELSKMKETQLTVLRRERIGFVFQAYNLLSSLTVLQNITLPLRLAGKRVDRGLLDQVVRSVGLADRMNRLPSELSGGQQQRVAIARALITRPDAVFADEPTGALDTRTARQVLELLRHVVTDMGQTVLMVTHDPVAASYADSVVFLADGQLAGEMRRPTPERIAAQMTHLGEPDLV